MPHLQPSPKRIAIFGGDSRNIRQHWPAGFEVEHFESQKYGGDGPLRQLLSAAKRGKLDVIIVLTQWTGHPANHAIKAMRGFVRVLHWDRGAGELARQLPTFLAQ